MFVERYMGRVGDYRVYHVGSNKYEVRLNGTVVFEARNYNEAFRKAERFHVQSKAN